MANKTNTAKEQFDKGDRKDTSADEAEGGTQSYVKCFKVGMQQPKKNSNGFAPLVARNNIKVTSTLYDIQQVRLQLVFRS